MNYKEFLKNKKISVVGLGPHGEMMTDIKFLVANKAKVSLYDMRSEARLFGQANKLKEIGVEKNIFGSIPLEDLLKSELIILSPEISKKSFFLKKVIEAKVQIEYPDTLFFKLAPGVMLIGVMGSYGKSTVSHLIYNILKKSFAGQSGQGLFYIDPDSTHGALTHLKKIKKDDVVLARIPEHLMTHYCDIHICPYVAVVTSVIPFDILELQTYNNFIVASDDVVDVMKSRKSFASKAKILRIRGNIIPADWNMVPRTAYDLENSALALQTSELFKVSIDIAKDVIMNFFGLKGRIELVKKLGGVEYYNDASSITPRATLGALRTLGKGDSGRSTILILGGAYTNQNYDELVENIPSYVRTIILLPGSGSIGLRSMIEDLPEIDFIQVLTLEEAVTEAMEIAEKGNKVLFSPAFDAIGVDISRKERGERFLKAVRGL